MAILKQSPELEIPDDRGKTKVLTKRPSGTVTLLFTDIEGSTRLWDQVPEAMGRALRRHDELLRSVIEASGGCIFKTAGDALCSVFSTANQAVEAAREAQRVLAVEAWPQGAALRIRMALHTGECEETYGNYFGPTLNRLEGLGSVGHGGQVLLSRATADLLRDCLPLGIGLRELGTHRLKDLSRPEEVFQLVAEGLEADFPPLRSLDDPSPPNNLPEFLSSFVGRRAEVVRGAQNHRAVPSRDSRRSGRGRKNPPRVAGCRRTS